MSQTIELPRLGGPGSGVGGPWRVVALGGWRRAPDADRQARGWETQPDGASDPHLLVPFRPDPASDVRPAPGPSARAGEALETRGALRERPAGSAQAHVLLTGKDVVDQRQRGAARAGRLRPEAHVGGARGRRAAGERS